MEVVLRSDTRPHSNDKDVSEAGDEGHDPHRYPQHHVGQQVLERRDPIRVGLALSDVRRVGAVLEILKISGTHYNQDE